MIVLGIETSAGHSSIGLCGDSTGSLEKTDATKNSFTESLYVLIDDLLDMTETAKCEIDGIAVCIGPGSFTGVRVGLSTAKGLAYGLRIPLIGIIAFNALALPVPADQYPVCCIIPYKRDIISYTVIEQPGLDHEPEIVEGAWDDLTGLQETFRSIAIQDAGNSEKAGRLFTSKKSIFTCGISGKVIAEAGLEMMKAGYRPDLKDIEPVYMHSLKFRKREKFDPGK